MPVDIHSKIMTLDEIARAVGARPRPKSVIMCHGTFDIVHPGHIRHLLYAKEKADVLIASITADEFILKSTYKPYVTEQLRASNLAALQMVDFVFVDRSPTPVDSILKLQPDFFAKGYEYTDGGIHPKTQEEMNALETYGGEMVFTPGDVVYSSSALQELHIPNLSVEQLLSLMESENVTFGDLRKTLKRMTGVPIHVVGDTIVDGYSHCSVLGASAKYPAFSVHHEHTDLFAGAAAIVACHMRAAGARVTFTTMLGNDAHKDFVLQEMKKSEVTVLPLVDKSRPTTYKERFVADGYRLLQVDRMDNRTISDKQLQGFAKNLSEVEAAAVVFSDFRHGIFNRHTVAELVNHIPAKALKAADSQVSNRWGNILDFNGFDLLTPNEKEARFALGDQELVVRPLAMELFKRAQCKHLILKLGERGMIVYRAPGPQPRQFFNIGTFVRRLVDPIGAGDALLAYSTLGLVVTSNIVIASILGAIAAASACERQGNTPISPEIVDELLTFVEKRARFE